VEIIRQFVVLGVDFYSQHLIGLLGVE